MTPRIPSYATLSFNDAPSGTWSTSTTDTRFVQESAAGSTTRIASYWVSATSFSINLTLNDNQSHRLALYFFDLDQYQGGRNERIDLIDTASGTVAQQPDHERIPERQVPGLERDRKRHDPGDQPQSELQRRFERLVPRRRVSTMPSATASFVGTDPTTQGTWKGTYGGDGFDIPQDPSANDPTIPSYAALSFNNAPSGTWSTSTTDTRFVQESAAGSTTRIASYWVSATSFSINLTLNDNQSHLLALYFFDLDQYQGGRNERIDLIDTASGTVLNSQTMSGFQNGKYLVWNVTGNVTILVTNLNPNSNALLNGLFLGGASSTMPSATASFVGTDTTTQGTWKGTYGGDGFDIPQDPSANDPTIPSYAALSFNNAPSGTWSTSTTDTRFVQESAAGSTTRIASYWVSATSFSIDLTLNDNQSHLLALYFFDLDQYQGGRNERIDLIDTASGTVLNSQTMSGFQNGKYLVWNVTGNVTILVTNLNPNSNALLNGLFLGAAAESSSPVVATPAAASANPVTSTTTVLSVLGADPSYPESDLTYIWSTTSAPPGATPPTFGVNDTNAAQNTTVMFDQAGTYTFQVTIADPSSLSVTSTVTVVVAQALTTIVVAPASATVSEDSTEPFTALAVDQFGQALANPPTFTWSVDTGGAGGSVSTAGLYTAPGSETGSDTVRAASGSVSGTAAVTVLTSAATVAYLGTDTTTEGNWEETYGSDGYDIPGLTTNLPSYAEVTPGGTAGASVWMASASDPRALQEPGSTGRIASGWFSGSSAVETIDVNLTDGQPHLLALDAMDWDGAGGGRSEQVELISDATGAVLDTRTLNDFGAGVYLVWQVSGSVTIQVTSLNSGADAVVNGLFLSSPATPLAALGLDLATFAGASYSGPVATFTDANPGTTAGDFIASIVWGDGNTSTGSVAPAAQGGFVVTGANTYSASPTGAVTVQIDDGAGHQATAEPTATIVNPPMLSSVTPIQEPTGTSFSGTLATFTGSIPAALQSGLTYSIQWGDGSADSTGIPSFGNGTLSVPGTHTYSTAGPYRFTVELLWNSPVIVSGGGSASIGGVAAPVANNDDYATALGQPLTIDASAGVLANDQDSTGGPLTATRVAPAAHGTVVLNSDGSFTYTPNAGFAGLDSFTYQASDGSLLGNVATVFLAVFNGPPVARNEVYTAVHDQMLTIAAPGVLFNDTDPAGLPLTAVTERTVTTQQGGTVTLNADGSFSYTPRATFHGLDSFTYTVSNGGLESTSATVTINVTETMPVGRADSYTIPEDDASNVAQESVLLNDTDADGDALTALMASGAGSYPQDAVHFYLFTNGTFVYQPTTGYFGPDSFTYEAFDGLDYSNQVTVTILVSNQRPTVQNASYTLPAVATTVAAASGVLATATDPFGYSLTALEDSGPSSLTLNSDGSFTYTPTAAAPYSDSFIFHASDGVNPSATGTVTLNIEDALPSPGSNGSDGSTYTYAVQPGGSTSWTAAAGVLSAASDPYGYPLTATEDTPPEGTLTLNSDGSFTYAPPSTSFTGSDTFTYTVSDGVYTSLPATVTINVDSTEQPTADTDVAYTYSVPPKQLLTTTASDGILARASDPYGYSLTAQPVPDFSDGTETTNSDGSFTYTVPDNSTLTVNPDGSFVFTPTIGFAGTDTFPYLVYDGLNSTQATFTINVDNTELPTADTGAAYSYAVQPGATLTTTSANGLLSAAFDPYGYALTAVSNGSVPNNSDGSFTYTTDDGTLTVNPDGSFTYTPSASFLGIDTFTYAAYDGLNDSPPATFSIDVTPSASGGGGSSGDDSGATRRQYRRRHRPGAGGRGRQLYHRAQPDADHPDRPGRAGQRHRPGRPDANRGTGAERGSNARYPQPPERRPVHLHAHSKLHRARLVYLRGQRRHVHERPGHGVDHRHLGRAGWDG